MANSCWITVSWRSIAIRSRSSRTASSWTLAWRRALSIAAAAAAARATVNSSSASVNTSPVPLSVRYRFPNTSPRTTIGTPRNERIGGWFGGNPKLAGCSREVRKPQRVRVRDEESEDAVTLGQNTDGAERLVVDSGDDELGQRPTGPIEHTERAVAGVHEVACGIDDALEGRGEVEIRPDGHHGVHEVSQPGAPGGSAAPDHSAMVFRPLGCRPGRPWRRIGP